MSDPPRAEMDLSRDKPVAFELPDGRRTAEVRVLLREFLLPLLRKRAIAGSLPHFYRARGDRLDLLGISFHRFSQEILVDIGRIHLSRDETETQITKQQRNIAFCPLQQRARIASISRIGPGWAFHAAVCPDGLKARIAQIATSLDEKLGDRAEAWWRSEILETDSMTIL